MCDGRWYCQKQDAKGSPVALPVVNLQGQASMGSSFCKRPVLLKLQKHCQSKSSATSGAFFWSKGLVFPSFGKIPVEILVCTLTITLHVAKTGFESLRRFLGIYSDDYLILEDLFHSRVNGCGGLCSFFLKCLVD